MVDLNSPYNFYCSTQFEPMDGCSCDTIAQVTDTVDLKGYMEAIKVFYGRGA